VLDFLDEPDTQLNTWPYDGDVGIHYSASELFCGYVLDQYGGRENASALAGEDATRPPPSRTSRRLTKAPRPSTSTARTTTTPKGQERSPSTEPRKSLSGSRSWTEPSGGPIVATESTRG
jgi:hypothetical protein